MFRRFRINPVTKADAVTNAASALLNAGDFAQAEGLLRQAIQLDAVHQEAHLTLGLLLLEKKQLEEAARLLRYVVELNPQ